MKKNISQNYKYKALFINQYSVYHSVIEWMPPKGLVKAKS
jgi:hypothetical protein